MSRKRPFLLFISWVGILTFLTATSAVYAQAGQPLPSRHEFVAHLHNVHSGMTEDQVVALLGWPDDARPGYDSSEDWLYGIGTASHFPTLGTVTFDKSRHVSSTDGGEGAPPSEKIVSERDLRHMLDVFGTTKKRSDNQYNFNPLPYMQAANALLPYGKTKISAAFNEYVRVGGRDGDDLLPLFQILFEPMPGKPLNQKGRWPFMDPPYPADEDRISRFPFVIVGDVPLMVAENRTEGISSRDEPLPFLKEIIKHYPLREHPLQPAPQPLELLDKLEASDQCPWKKPYAALHWNNYKHEDTTMFTPTPHDVDDGRIRVMHQLLFLVASSYSPAYFYVGDRTSAYRRISPARWQQMCSEVAPLSLQWDSDQNVYFPHQEKARYPQKAE